MEVSPQIMDNTDPMDQVFDKNKKLKGANKAVKEELVSEKMASKDHDGGVSSFVTFILLRSDGSG